jgi:hypothetical protein
MRIYPDLSEVRNEFEGEIELYEILSLDLEIDFRTLLLALASDFGTRVASEVEYRYVSSGRNSFYLTCVLTGQSARARLFSTTSDLL